MRKLRVLDAARVEYLETLRYYHKIDRDLARSFRSEYRAQVARITEFPESVPRVSRTPGFHLRRILLDRFQYALVFAVLDGEIVVVAVHHQRRKPGYWRARLANVRP